jgi:lysophospholipase L1-like esterase
VGLSRRPSALLVVGLALALAPPARAQTSERFVAFGDSLTAGVGDETGQGGYPSRLQSLLASPTRSVTVENRGVDGEHTSEGLSRIGTLVGESGDTLILMEGTNDAFSDISPESIASNLLAIARKARQQGFSRVLLATVPPIGRTSTGTRTDLSIAVSEAIRQAAYEASLPQPDPHHGLFQLANLFANYYSGDGIHLNANGYAELARIFADSIDGNDTLSPAPSFVTPANESTNVAANALLEVIVFDPLAGVDHGTATLTVNGVAVPTTVAGDARRTVLQSRPGNLAGRPFLGVDVRDLATPSNRLIEDVSRFTVRGATFLKGDIDQSGRVDGADLVALGFSFGAQAGGSRYKASADLNSNGRVDGTDLAILAANFGLSSF